jgi:hypothetical protein
MAAVQQRTGVSRGSPRPRSGELALVAGLLALPWPGPASAATQIGETFPANSSGGTCIDGRTLFQTGSPGGQYAAPSDGVITAWGHYGSPDFNPVSALKLKVARPVGGSDYQIVGDSPLETAVPGVLNTYTNVRIPVAAGDVLATYLADDGFCLRAPAPGYTTFEELGDPAPGTTVALTGPSDYQLDLSAMLEPDCDSDGFGDETQDSAPACPRTLTLDANKNKVKKGKRVTLAGQLNEVVRQGPCESSQAVELQRKKPSQPTFATIEQLQTDAAGAFSTKEKVKKTFEYRAQVSETATCGGQVSNTEKVKVKKKK